MVGKHSIAWVILGQIRIQQVDRDRVPGDTLKIVPPCPDNHRTVLDRYLDHGIFEHEKFFQWPGLIRSGLNSLCIEMLLEVTLAMEQSDGA